MAIRITCPSCEATVAVNDTLRGKKVRCPKCQGVVPVPASPNKPDPDEEDCARPDRRVAAKPSSSSSGRRPRDEDDDEAPVRKPVRARDEEEDEAPVRKPASRIRANQEDEEAPRRRPMRGRDDDEDDLPLRKKKVTKGGPSPAFLIGIGGVALVLVGLVVGGCVLAFRSPSKPETSPSTPLAQTTPVNGNPIVPVVQNPIEKKEEPKALPATLSAEDLQRVKKATVHLRAELSSGGVADGTGFFAVEPGVIITNAHVLGMLTPDTLAPKSVSVTVHSGEPGEFKVQGLVLGIDRANDLAVLRTDSTTSPFPAPLEVDTATKLIETQKLFVFGFPLGTKLGKNITVSDSSVTSLRRDKNGILAKIQVNGGMQPGNSGGPVTDSRGVVVGVAVSIIQGTQLNFAIPGDLVKQVLAGGISDQDFGTPYTGTGGQPQIPVRLTTIDPLQRIRQVKVDVWTGPAGDSLPATTKEPQPKPGDGSRQRITATAKSGGFTADVPLPSLPPGQVYWAQPVLANAAGVSQWAAARSIPFDPKLVIERRPSFSSKFPPGRSFGPCTSRVTRRSTSSDSTSLTR